MHILRWWLAVILGVSCASAVHARSAGAQEGLFARSDRAPRFLFKANTGGLVPLDIERTPMLMRRIALTLNGVPLREALAQVERASGLAFNFLDQAVPEKRVRLDAREITVAAALTDILLGVGLDVVFTVDGRAMLLKRAAASPNAVPRQTGTVAGRVTEANGTPVASALVTIAGTAFSRTTDEKGQYRIAGVPVGEHEIRVRRLGFGPVTRRITVTVDAVITADFILARAARVLTEVVTTATGERSRLEVGNSIGTIKADSLVPTTLIRNMADLLTARTPGVIVSNTSGLVGTPSRIRIRGVNSLSLNNDPIVILDGVRMLAQTTTAPSQTDVGSGSIELPFSVYYGSSNGQKRQLAPSRLDDIDPNTIESIDVLRGPSAASLYGTEAANGVIVIKTKKGTTGAFRLNLTADEGQSHIPGTFPLWWSGWGRGRNGELIVDCTLAVPSRSVADGTCVQDSVTAFNPANDPLMSTLGTGTARNLGATLSGGSAQLQQFLSLRATDNVGIVKMSEMEQRRITRTWGAPAPSWMIRPNTERVLNGSSRTSIRAGSALDGSLTATGAYRDVLNGGSGMQNTGDGQASRLAAYGPWDTLRYLPSETQRARNTSLAKRGSVSSSVNYTPGSWLTLHGTLGGDYTLRSDDALARSMDCSATFIGSDSPTISPCVNGHANARSETFVTTANMGAQLSFTLMPNLVSRTAIGQQYSRTKYYSLSAGSASGTNLAFGTELLTPSPIAITAGNQLFDVREGRDEAASAGWYLEQTGAFRERLFVTAAFRRDAASAFGWTVNKAAPVYPKFSASWLASDEPFFRGGSLVSSLRLRAAYGQSGNQAGQTSVLNDYLLGQTLLDGTTITAIIMRSLGNPALRPERTRELEGGFDLALLDDERIRLEFTMYHKMSRDAIATANLPPSYGVASLVNNVRTSSLTQVVNYGSVENRGQELTVTARILDGRTIGWELTANASRNTNKLVSKNPSVPSGNTTGFRGPQLREGYPLHGHWGYNVLSYADRDGNGILEEEEMSFGGLVFRGAPYATGEIGWASSVVLWGGMFRVNSNVQQVLGQTTKIRSTSEVGGAATNYLGRSWFDPTSTIAQQAAGMEALKSFGWMGESSSIRLAELSLTYTMPAAMVRRLLRAQSASVTFAGRNLGFWSSYAGKDPNVDTSGALGDITGEDGSGVPQPRNWTVRLNLGL